MAMRMNVEKLCSVWIAIVSVSVRQVMEVVSRLHLKHDRF